MKPLNTKATMERSLSFHKKAALVMRWPALLDQELRRKFGDGIAPSTGFNKEKKQYVTTCECGDDTALARDVTMFIDGFQTAVSTLTE